MDTFPVRDPKDAHNFDSLISTISWEERFLAGLDRLLNLNHVNAVTLLRYMDWAQVTETATSDAIRMCRSRGLNAEVIPLQYDRPDENWKALRNSYASSIPLEGTALIDISTMPREAIWGTFYFLEGRMVTVRYAYHRPRRYASDWLSRDPGRPRLQLQMSGELGFGREVALIATTGFDISRTEQLMRTFEPQVTVLAVQAGKQFRNLRKNLEAHRKLYQLTGDEATVRSNQFDTRLELSPIDAYAQEHGKESIEQHVVSLLGSYNILMASLGPKPSAVAVYKVHRRYPATALVYAPSREFNPNYSYGIGSALYGWL
jgi:hypothetical protein